MKAVVGIIGAVLLPSVALAAITNIGPLFPATSFSFTQTMPMGMPAINTAGSVRPTKR